VTLIADADVPAQVLSALRVLSFDIATLEELGIPVRPDRDLMAVLMQTDHRVLLTMDTGIRSQAYLYRYAQAGLTVVLLRWKGRGPKDLQEMAIADSVRALSEIPPGMSDQLR